MTMTETPVVTIIANPAGQLISDRPEPAGGFLSRDHILEATESCFAEAGYDGTTIRAIASRLGCSVGSIYRYFSDKRQLLLAVAERLIEPVVAALDEGADFEASLRVYLQQAGAGPQRYKLLFWLADGDDSSSRVSPESVERIIEAWSPMLGGQLAAERAWVQLHGMLILGRSNAAIIRAILESPGMMEQAEPLPQPRPAVSVSIGREREPLPAEPAAEEDVTLL